MSMPDLDLLSEEHKEALAEDCEDYLLHRSIPLFRILMTQSFDKHSKKDIDWKNSIDQSVSTEFWQQVEQECKEHEITVDYYLMEFYTS